MALHRKIVLQLLRNNVYKLLLFGPVRAPDLLVTADSVVLRYLDPFYGNTRMHKIEYLISTEPAWLDLDVIHPFLSEHSYWARGIPRDVVARSIEHSLCFGVYAVQNTTSNSDRRQIGFARITTDRATFAYLADVFILPEHRGQGLSKRLVEAILAHPDLQGLRRWMLATADAHELYRRFGFTGLSHPERFMQRHNPNVYGDVGTS